MLNYKSIFLLFMILYTGIIPGVTQNAYHGDITYRYLKNYTPDEYQSQPQNWCIVQDKRGIIYAANGSGLLEYDGVNWRGVNINNCTVYSLALDDKGTIYVGGRDEIGFIAADSSGPIEFRSLLPYLDNSLKNFGEAWRVHATKEGIYFNSQKFLFRWDQDSQKIRVWEPQYSFDISFICNGNLYIHQDKVGLMRMINDSLVVAPGGERFALEAISMIVPFDKQRALVGTRSNGFYLYDGSTFTPFSTGADAFLKEKIVSSALRLSDGNFALGTLFSGLVILDAQGKFKEIITKSSGLQDDCVLNVFEDYQGNLWLALNKGITKIEYASPFSIYDEKSADLTGLFPISVVRHSHENKLYAVTIDGLFSLTPKGKFIPVPGIGRVYYSIISIGESLLAATKRGIFQVKNNGCRKIFAAPSFVLSRSRQDADRTWAGTGEGLISLSLDKRTGLWVEEYIYKNISQEIISIEDDLKGNLWLGTLTQGVIKVEFPTGKIVSNPAVFHYGPEQNLPDGHVYVCHAADRIMFAAEKGVYRFDEKKNRFIPDPVFGKKFADGSRSVFRIAEDNHKNIWLHSMTENFQSVPRADGTYQINEKVFRRILLAQANAIYPDPDGNFTWFATNKGLIRYDSAIKKNCDVGFQTLIRKVWIAKKLVFDGSKNREDNDAKSRFPVIDYRDRNLRFEFAAPFFEAESQTKYQCLLLGYDKEWTAWAAETKKEYTNLDAGLYTFRVRAQNVYGAIGREDSFQFRVLPPWFRTWWAYLIYFAAAFFMMFLVIKWRSLRLVREKQRLEHIIAERTREIKDKNFQLLEQSEKLKEMDQVKSRFFANISHEFRTPLTLIMGPLEKMLSSSRQNEQVRDLRLMLRNSQRLLGLINQLLELSRFDSGAIKLKAARQNIVPFLKGILKSFDSLAVQNDQVLEFLSGAEEIILYFDPARLEEMLANLLSNAIKFTPVGGKITLAVRVDKTGGKAGAGDYLEISISDTGPGIPQDQLPHIFDRFYQADCTYEHHHKGSGIGLSIAKEIVEIHHGTVAVRSSREAPTGTEFVVRLPMGDAHLEPSEIVDASAASWKLQEEAPAAPPKIPGLYLPEEEETEAAAIPAGAEAEQPISAGPEKIDHEKDIILVVEDSVDMRLYIRGALEPIYSVVEAGDGREGLQKARDIIPDLVVCDVMMPVMDGYDVCRGLKSDRITSHIPVILLTARAGEESVLAGLESGADDYITKPFSTKILGARIKNLIDLRRQLQETFKREMTLQPAKLNVSGVDKEFIEDLYRVLKKNTANPEFNVEDLSRKLYMNRVTLYKKINALTGEAPSDFIRSYRLKRGAELLKTGSASVVEVALEVGFSSSSYFIKCFKEKFHRLPSEYQRTEKMKMV